LSVTVASARTFGALLTAQIGIFGAAAVALGAFSPELAYLLGGGDFAPASRLVPGLVLSTGLGATLFVLITAAGVLRRGRWVAYATLGGATCEVVVVYVVIHSLGIEALAAGAVAGRLAGVVILAAAVTDVARISRVGVLFLIVSVGLVVLITLLNATPETSLMWRASIGVVAVLAGTYLLIRLARTSPSEPRSATSTS
jgi:O-antigen/teichoic acid export membrane protein